MLDRAKAENGLAADALRRAVRGDQLGMFGLELLQFIEQAIELAVGDLRLGFDVIQVVVVVEKPAQLVDTVFVRGHGLSASSLRPFTAARQSDGMRGLLHFTRTAGVRNCPSASRLLELWSRPARCATDVPDPGTCSPAQTQ